MAEDGMSEAKWYVAHTYSGYENKVMESIKKTIENRHLEDQILEVRVPNQEVEQETEQEVEREVEEIRDGVQKKVKKKIKQTVKKKVKKKLFPGYVLINMVMNDDTWYVVRNTRGVTGFVGPGSKPVPLTETEIFNIEAQVNDTAIEFAVGDTVKVVDSTWENTVGMIQSVNPNKRSVTITVEAFGGRETPLEVNFADVRKI